MSIGYDNLGHANSITRALGPSESLSYGTDLRLSALSFAFADTAKNVTFNYTYNLAGQPLTATANNASYQWASSRTAAAYASDGQNRYTTVGANTLAYEGRANTSSTGLASFSYDGLNRMINMGSTNTLGYDAVGRLNLEVDHTAGTTQFLSDGQQIIAEYSNTNALLRRYIPGPALDQPLIWFEGTGTASSGARWLLADAFGSIAAVGTSGASNTTLGINTYDEFGVSAASNIGRFQYKGMAYIPEIGLYHDRARTYSQYLGRFLQPDPSGYSDGMNLYSFVKNAPINQGDPTGLGCTTTNWYIPGSPGYPNTVGTGTPTVASQSGSVTFCEDGHAARPAHPSGPPVRAQSPQPSAKCLAQKALTGFVGGAVGGAALAVSTGQLEALIPAILVGGAVGGVANAASTFGGTAGIVAAGASSILGHANGGYSAAGAVGVLGDAFGGGVPTSALGIPAAGAIGAGTGLGTAVLGETFGLGALGTTGAFGASAALGAATTFLLDQFLSPLTGCN
jgi:RHS repeat-associated protein